MSGTPGPPSLLAGVESMIDEIAGWIWGPFLLMPLLLATGLYLTIRLRGIQFRRLGHALYLGLIQRKESDGLGDISHFQALMTALAATVGTGNIVGVATAIALGGPGALFWMWVTGLVGMATKYSEALLSIVYRVDNPRGEKAGGPMYFLAQGLRWPRIGRILAGLFALFTIVASFGTGNMVQSHSVADSLRESFGVPMWISGILMAGLLAAVILGGIRSIGRVAGLLVPAMIVLYLAGAASVLLLHLDRLDEALALVFKGAFSGTAATGGFLGTAVAQAIRFGVARGIFSNESGLGSAGIAAAAAQTTTPARQALVAMTQTFIDTIVVCSLTGLAILTTGAWESGLNGAPLTQFAFREGLPGVWGDTVVAVSLSLFAFSTLLGWSFYGERCAEYLLGLKAVRFYRMLFVAATFLGTVYSLNLVWSIADVMNGLMALPNLIGLLLLSGVLVRETRSYRRADPRVEGSAKLP